MLDTDICSYLIKKNPASLQDKFTTHVGSICMSTVTCAELLFGAEKRASDALSRQVSLFISLVEVVDWDIDMARTYARLRNLLALSIDNLDLMIASASLARGCILVTNNLKHFDRIPGLEVERWS